MKNSPCLSSSRVYPGSAAGFDRRALLTAAGALVVATHPPASAQTDAAAYGGRQDAYDVLLLAKDGTATVYQHDEGRKS